MVIQQPQLSVKISIENHAEAVYRVDTFGERYFSLIQLTATWDVVTWEVVTWEVIGIQYGEPIFHAGCL